MIALYFLYHQFSSRKWHRPAGEAFLAEHVSILEEPSIESLICHAMLSQPTGWEPAKQEEMRKEYLAQRRHKTGLSLGPVLEAAIALEAAEAFRLNGDIQVACNLLSEAVENLPGNARLLEIEQKWAAGEIGPIRWRDVLATSPEP